MNDYESEIFSRTKAAILATDAFVTVKSETEERPPSFPFVSLVQVSNMPYQKTASFDESANHMAVMFELNCFTNDKSGKKGRNKKIIQSALDFLCSRNGLGLLLTYNRQTPNADTEIHRRVVRIEGVINKDNLIFWR